MPLGCHLPLVILELYAVLETLLTGNASTRISLVGLATLSVCALRLATHVSLLLLGLGLGLLLLTL